MSIFTWVPDLEARGTFKPRVLSANFGDGYAQELADGINNNPGTYALNFSVLNLTTYQAIMNFLEGLNGASAFDWTTPKGVTGRFKCKDWSDTSSAVTYSISATFVQVYGV